MTTEDIVRQFEKLWEDSLRRAASTRGWSEMTLREMAITSSRLRRALEQYGQEWSDGAPTHCGGSGSQQSSRRAG